MSGDTGIKIDTDLHYYEEPPFDISQETRDLVYKFADFDGLTDDEVKACGYTDDTGGVNAQGKVIQTVLNGSDLGYVGDDEIALLNRVGLGNLASEMARTHGGFAQNRRVSFLLNEITRGASFRKDGEWVGTITQLGGLWNSNLTASNYEAKKQRAIALIKGGDETTFSSFTSQVLVDHNSNGYVDVSTYYEMDLRTLLDIYGNMPASHQNSQSNEVYEQLLLDCVDIRNWSSAGRTYYGLSTNLSDRAESIINARKTPGHILIDWAVTVLDKLQAADAKTKSLAFTIVNNHVTNPDDYIVISLPVATALKQIALNTNLSAEDRAHAYQLLTVSINKGYHADFDDLVRQAVGCYNVAEIVAGKEPCASAYQFLKALRAKSANSNDNWLSEAIDWNLVVKN
ncbi:hypothetical protein K1X76_00850 [bacterium]|nr:hypothetical protein [bacterium]